MQTFKVGQPVKKNGSGSASFAGLVVRTHNPAYRDQTCDVQWADGDKNRIEKRVNSRYLRGFTEHEKIDLFREQQQKRGLFSFRKPS